MNITISITGDKKLINKLRRLGSSIYQLRSAMESIGENAAKYYSNQGMNSQGGVFGNTWKPLSRAYAINKAKKYAGRPPLVASGAMRDSFTFVASDSQVLVGNSASYFKYHQSTLPRKKIPRRQMMGINEPIRRMVRQQIQDEVRRKIRTS